MKREWKARKTHGQRLRFLLANAVCFALERWFRYITANLRRIYDGLDEYRRERQINAKPTNARYDWAGLEDDWKANKRRFAFGAVVATLFLDNNNNSFNWFFHLFNIIN